MTEHLRQTSPRLLICGLGSIGRRHLRNLSALGAQDIILLRTGKSTMPDEGLEGYPVERDLGTALARWKPDGVIVSNPTSLHEATTRAALDAGCHVLLEKPVSDALQPALPLLAAEHSSVGKVLVGFQFRYHPGILRARTLLESEVIGKPVSVTAHWGEYLPGWHPWEDYRSSYSARSDLGGGVVNTLSHPIDYLRLLFGEVHAVSALLSAHGGLEMDVEDTATILLEFQSGVHGVVHVNYTQRPPRHDFEIVGQAGSIRWDNSDGAVRWWLEDEGAWFKEAPPEGFERNHLFLDEARHFLDVVAGADTPRCTLLDGIRALEITEAAHESQRSGKRVVLEPYSFESEANR